MDTYTETIFAMNKEIALLRIERERARELLETSRQLLDALDMKLTAKLIEKFLKETEQ